MHVLIVHAHPKPASFNAALRDTAKRTLQELGHSVTVSDLYAQEFEAVAGARDFTTPHNPSRLGYVHEQRRATATRAYAPDILAEQDRITNADFVIFQFPCGGTQSRRFSRVGRTAC